MASAVQSTLQHMGPKTREQLGLTTPVTLTPLKGGTCNTIFKIEQAGVVLRSTYWTNHLEGYGAHAFKRRKMEAETAIWAAEQGLAPKMRAVDGKCRWMIMDYVEGGTLQNLNIPVLAQTLKKLHDQPIPSFLEDRPASTTFNRFFHQLRKVQEVITEKGMTFPERFEKLHREASSLEATIRMHYHDQRAVCHLSLRKENILDNNGNPLFIDFTMSGPDDPFMDIAYIRMYFDLTPEQEEQFLQAYLGNNVTEEDRKHYALIRPVPLLTKVTWALMNCTTDGTNTSTFNELKDEDVPPLSHFTKTIGQKLTGREWMQYALSAEKEFYSQVAQRR